MSANGLDELRVEVNNKTHRQSIGPGEDATNEDLGVLVLAKKIEAAGRQETLWKINSWRENFLQNLNTNQKNHLEHIDPKS